MNWVGIVLIPSYNQVGVIPIYRIFVTKIFNSEMFNVLRMFELFVVSKFFH